MNTLKVKSLLISLFAIALISSFLTSCEKNEAIDAVNQEILSQKVLNPEVADAIENIDQLPDEAFKNAPSYLPTEVEIKQKKVTARSSSTSVDCRIFVAAGGDPCGFSFSHSTDWDSSFGSCSPSNYTWINLLRKRADGNFTTEWSGIKYGDYDFFNPVSLSTGEYISNIYAWNQCEAKWTLETSTIPYSPCD